MAMTTRELEYQKKAKLDEAKRLARLQAQANQGPLRSTQQTPIAEPEVAPQDRNVLRGAPDKIYPPSRPVDLPTTPANLKPMVDEQTPSKPNLTPAYNPAVQTVPGTRVNGNAPIPNTAENWYASLPPSEQLRQRTQPGIAQTVAPATQADYLYRTATDPNSTFRDRITAVAGLPFASRTDTAPPADNRLVGTRDRGGNLQVFTPDEAANVMQESEFQSALAAETGLRRSQPGAVGDAASGAQRQTASGIYQTGPNSFTDDPTAEGAKPYSLRGNNLNTYSSEAFNQKTMDMAMASARRRAEPLMNKRLSGASYGGNILRDMNRINKQAVDAYNKVNQRTNNWRAAQSAYDAVQGQAKNLLDADRTQSYREGDQLRAQTAQDKLGADQDYRAASLQLEQQILGSANYKDQQAALKEYTKMASTTLDKEGKAVYDPQKDLRLQDAMTGLSGPDQVRLLRESKVMDDVMNDFAEKTGIQFMDPMELFKTFDDGSLGFRDEGRLGDILGAYGFTINDFLSDILPGGASGDVLQTKDGIRISTKDLDKMGLTPRIIRRLYGEQKGGRRRLRPRDE